MFEDTKVVIKSS